jgi:TIR domain
MPNTLLLEASSQMEMPAIYHGASAMGFVREGDYPDVFVSYAHVDNQGDMPWVTNLVRHLGDQLAPRLGSKEVHLWRDYDALDGNHPFPSKIIDSVRNSATLLVVMSEGYLYSEWCARERNAFLNFARSFIEDGRVFLVHRLNTDRKARPREFGDLEGYQFWAKDPTARGAMRTLGWPDFRESAYCSSVLNLADDLARKLKKLKTKASDPPVLTNRIFLARSTDDMEEREDELKSYLTQAGVGIFPETWYPEEDERAFRLAAQADLARCSVFVQLLSKVNGRRVGGSSGRRCPLLQHEIAQSTGKPILQWRDFAEDPVSVLDADHRALLEGARACGFGEFKRAVVEAARCKRTAPSPPPSGVVFINADRDDLGMARELSTLFATQHIESYVPILDGSPEKVRRNLEENLKECDGLVLVYGAAEPFWVQEQLRQRKKIS